MTEALAAHRDAIRAAFLADEQAAIAAMRTAEPPDSAAEALALTLITHLREAAKPGLLETVLAEYGLSSQEGVALMCLAEALLRVPDTTTIDALIRDKLAPGAWDAHLGHSPSLLVNAASWGLLVTGRLLRPASGDVLGALHGMVRRLGEPVVRRAVAASVRQMGEQFVLGEDIGAAMRRAAPEEARGGRFSYDMLGEAARTAADAARYEVAYAGAIAAIATRCGSDGPARNPGISVKLSALHPRYEYAQRARVMAELVPRVLILARAAAAADMGLNIDAEEQDRLDLSLDVIEAVLADPSLRGWDGFGLVVQAYGRRSLAVIEWAQALATSLDRRLMLRLVKGAYWDSEIKAAQVAGLASFPVWTRKASTDLAYQHAARRLLGMRARIFPQFATHNAQTAAAVMQMAGDTAGFEFQRLHGMGEALHGALRDRFGVASRTYAPVGEHVDLLAYLVRRLLENGANSSFVHRVLDAAVPASCLAASPSALLAGVPVANPGIPAAPDLYGVARRNSAGVAFSDAALLESFDAALAPWRRHQWIIDADGRASHSPANPAELVGRIREADEAEIAAAMQRARAAQPGWAARGFVARAAVLEAAADSFEQHGAELMALCIREAGKTAPDAVAELREAVDFLRYYAAEARGLSDKVAPRGVFACISPWNFPLAIFAGQVAAALVAGNAVLAKPAPQTPLIAARAVALLHAAGVPPEVLHLLPGGATAGAALVALPDLDGVCFTGSIATARRIERSIAQHMHADTPLIAETGGINAMLVDSTALPEQVVRDAVASAFRSAGQRCSALRLLVVQEDIAPRVIAMLRGAMDELCLGDPWLHATDVGPLIDTAARDRVRAHVEACSVGVLHRSDTPAGDGLFVAPTLISVPDIAALHQEIFGPVLHVTTFPAGGLAQAVAAVNALGYGLTMGLQSRIEAHHQLVMREAAVGNLYINRNQIGAVVGVQPFGGEGLSGTGPKAGGPSYLARFLRNSDVLPRVASGRLPGPTGEWNALVHVPRGEVHLVVDEGADAAALHAFRARLEAAGNRVSIARKAPADPKPAVAHLGGAESLVALRRVLAAQEGPIRPILTPADPDGWFKIERCVSIDTTAAGGDVALVTAASG